MKLLKKNYQKHIPKIKKRDILVVRHKDEEVVIKREFLESLWRV